MNGGTKEQTNEITSNKIDSQLVHLVKHVLFGVDIPHTEPVVQLVAYCNLKQDFRMSKEYIESVPKYNAVQKFGIHFT